MRRLSPFRLVPILIAAFACDGCSGIRLEKPLIGGPDDWPVFAGSAKHDNAVPRPLMPPLTLAWEYDLSASMGDGSPVVIDSTVFAGNLRGELHAVHIRSGLRIGWISLGDAIEGAPAISGRVAVVALSDTKESLVAYDLVDARPEWKKEYGDIEVTPLLYHQRVYFGNLEGRFYCVEAATGDVIWSYDLPDNRNMSGFHSSAAAADSTIVVGADNGSVIAFEEATGHVRWTFATGDDVFAAPSIGEGAVYVGNIGGRVSAVGLTTGRLLWEFTAPAPVYGNISLSEGRALFGTLGGVVYALRQADGRPLWENDIGYPVNSGIAVAGDIAFVGTLKRFLLALRTGDGNVVWKKEVEGRIKTTPAIADGRLLVATDQRVLLSFRGESQ